MNVRLLLSRGVFLSCLVMTVPASAKNNSSCRESYDDLVVGIRELAREKLSLSQSFARPEKLLLLEQSFLECFKDMIQNGSNVNYADSTGQTPAIVAALYNLDPVLDLLKHEGADMNAKDGSGYSANNILKQKR